MLRFDSVARSVKRTAIFVAVLMAAPAARAHDSWLVAERSTVEPDASLRVAFVTADQFPIPDAATEPERVAEWVVVRPGQRTPVTGHAIEGKELAATIPFAMPGLWDVAIALKPQFIEIPADDFERYLRDEEAEAALAKWRASRGADGPGRELYTKFAKTYVEVGRAAEASHMTRVGHRLEIVPFSNPCRWRVGQEARVRVLLDGRPAPRLRVSSGHEGMPPHTYKDHAVTDPQGVARFRFDRPGLWFLRTHAIRETTDSPRADWESFWASITFRVIDGPSGRAGRPPATAPGVSPAP